MRKVFNYMGSGLLALSFLGLIACNNLTNNTSASNSSKEEKSNVDSTMFSTGDTKEISESDYDEVIDLSTLSSDYTINTNGVYHIKGEANDYQLIVSDNTNNDKNIHLVLDNVSMTNSKNACLYIKSASKVVMHLIGDNSLTSTYTSKVNDGTTKIDGAIYSKDDLTITGSGSLNVNSKLHGIVCKDDLKFTGGTVNVNSLNKSLDVNDSVRIKDSTINLEAISGDGIHLENDENSSFFYMESGELNIESALDGIDLSTSNKDFSGYFSFVGGNLNIISGGGSDSKTTSSQDSKKGVKSDNTITFSGGVINIDSKDDSIHSASTAYVTGGKLTLKTSDDGIHSDTKTIIKDGTLDISGHEGIEGKQVEISGGKITIVASDDGVNASNSITVSGGYIDITMGSGDVDGVDSNGTYTQTGGIVVARVSSVNEMAAPLDTDSTVNITGGTFIALGSFSNVKSKTTLNAICFGTSSSFGMGPGGFMGGGGRPSNNSSSSDTVSFSSGKYTLTNSNNEELLSFELMTKYTNLTIVSDKLVLNENYTINLNGSQLKTWLQSDSIITSK